MTLGTSRGAEAPPLHRIRQGTLRLPNISPGLVRLFGDADDGQDVLADVGEHEGEFRRFEDALVVVDANAHSPWRRRS